MYALYLSCDGGHSDEASIMEESTRAGSVKRID